MVQNLSSFTICPRRSSTTCFHHSVLVVTFHLMQQVRCQRGRKPPSSIHRRACSCLQADNTITSSRVTYDSNASFSRVDGCSTTARALDGTIPYILHGLGSGGNMGT